MRFLSAPQELREKKRAASRTCLQLRASAAPRAGGKDAVGQRQSLLFSGFLAHNVARPVKVSAVRNVRFYRSVKKNEKKKNHWKCLNVLFFSWKAQGFWELPLGHRMQTVGAMRLKRGLNSSAVRPRDRAALRMDVIFLT